MNLRRDGLIAEPLSDRNSCGTPRGAMPFLTSARVPSAVSPSATWVATTRREWSSMSWKEQHSEAQRTGHHLRATRSRCASFLGATPHSACWVASRTGLLRRPIRSCLYVRLGGRARRRRAASRRSEPGRRTVAMQLVASSSARAARRWRHGRSASATQSTAPAPCPGQPSCRAR